MTVHNMRAGIKSLKPFLDWLPLDYAMVLEVGTFAGDGAVEFLKSDKIEKIVCVDPFRGGYDPNDTASQSEMDVVALKWIYQMWANRGSKNVVLSMGMIWPDDNYDIIYLDANHKYEQVKHDIEYAMDMFRPGVLAGHDYSEPAHPGVKKAVDELLKDYEIKIFPDTSWAVEL